jgi:hypothetical protein
MEEEDEEKGAPSVMSSPSSRHTWEGHRDVV